MHRSCACTTGHSVLGGARARKGGRGIQGSDLDLFILDFWIDFIQIKFADHKMDLLDAAALLMSGRRDIRFLRAHRNQKTLLLASANAVQQILDGVFYPPGRKPTVKKGELEEKAVDQGRPPQDEGAQSTSGRPVLYKTKAKSKVSAPKKAEPSKKPKRSNLRRSGRRAGDMEFDDSGW